MLSKNTVITYARSAAAWLRFLAKRNLHWLNAVREDGLAWRDELYLSRKRSTVRTYITAVSELYRWAHQEMLLPARPFKTKSWRSRSNNQSVPEITTLKPRTGRQEVLNLEQFKVLRANLQNVIKDDDLRHRVDLMMRWAWGTGLRRFELAALTISQIAEGIQREIPFQQDSDVNAASLRGLLDRTSAVIFLVTLVPEHTKGQRGGAILVHRDLMRAAADMVDNLRLTLKHGKIRDFPIPLFPTRSGRFLSPSTIGRYYASAARMAGLCGGIHTLRHSFVTRVVEALEANGSRDARHLAKELARHASVSTTDLYIHLAEGRRRGPALAMAVTQVGAPE
jgi:integrase